MRPLFRREKTVDVKSVEDSLHIVHGSLRPDKLTLFSIVRDEMFFIPSFLKHHREIGVEQFLILDDGSEDGTEEYLREQSDVVIIKSHIRFGDRVKNDVGQVRRAGLAFKEVIPMIFLNNKFHIYLDADEFLFLPPGVHSVSTILETLKEEGRCGIAASLVEFFPANIHDWLEKGRPENLGELLDECPYFEPVPLIDVTESGSPIEIGRSKSESLFRTRIKEKRYIYIDIENLALRTRLRLTSAKTKIPIAYNGVGVRRNGSHGITAPVSSKILLTIGHFVFTRNFRAKVKSAIVRRSHCKRGAKYQAYNLLIRKLQEGDGSFLSEESTRFVNAYQFIDSGLMRWPEPL